jgi:hypothetical protein
VGGDQGEPWFRAEDAGERIVAMRLRQTLIQINAAGAERAQNAGIFTG